MAIIKIGQLSAYLIYLFLIPLSRSIRSRMPQIMDLANRIDQYPVINTACMFFGELLGGCLFFLQFCQFTRSQNQNEVVKKFWLRKVVSLDIQYSWKTFLSVCCFGVLDLFISIVFYNVGTFELKFLLRSTQIVVYAFLSVKVLHSKLYRHKYLSIAIIVIGVIIVNFYIDFEAIGGGLQYFLCFLGQLLYVIKYFGDKWVMQMKHFTPMLILLIEGICGFIMSFIVVLGLYLYCPSYYQGDYCKTFIYISQFEWTNLYDVLAYVLFSAIVNVCLFQTNYYFMPTVLTISDVLSSFVHWIGGSIIQRQVSVVSLVGYLISLFGSFVYNEIIILNFCSLSYYTKPKIEERSSEETIACNIELLSNIVVEVNCQSDDLL